MNTPKPRAYSVVRPAGRILAAFLMCLAVAFEAAGGTIFVTTTEHKISGSDPNDPAYRPGCSLQEAIFSANFNDNIAIAGYNIRQPIIVRTQCAPGSGDEDLIVLPVKAVFRLTHPVDDADNYMGPTGTPMVTSRITIQANGSTIEWAPEGTLPTPMRAFAVGPTGRLTISRAYIRGFVVRGGHGGDGGGGGGLGAGGAIYVNGGELTIEASTFEGNGAIGGNGGGPNNPGHGGGGGGGGLGGNGGGDSEFCREGSEFQVNGGGGGGSRGHGAWGTGCAHSGGGGGTVRGAVSSFGGFNCGGDGAFGHEPGFGVDGGDALCAGGGGAGGQEGGLGGGNGGRGAYGGGGGGGSQGGHGGHGGFGGGGGGGSSGTVFAADGGNGGFGAGGGAGPAEGIGDGDPGDGGMFGGNGSANGGGGGAGLGGAIFNDSGTVVVRNSTFTNNFVARGVGGGGARNGSDAGGAIFSLDGRLIVQYTTIARNQSTGSGGGIVVARLRTPALPIVFRLENTIVFANGSVDGNGNLTNAARQCSFVGDAVAADVFEGTGNLIQNNDNCLGVVSTEDPQLGPLGFNQGLTPTLAIPLTSPALDAADGSVTVDGVIQYTVDQRGQVRPSEMGYDIGAFELCVRLDGPCLLPPEFNESDRVNLTVAVSPAGTGTTSPVPGAHGYKAGSLVALTAVPNPGYGFANWSGDAVTDPLSASTTIMMNGDRSVTANFFLLPDFSIDAGAPLTIAVGGSGSATVTVNANAAFSQAVGLVASGMPPGISAVLTPSSVTPPASGSASAQLQVTLGPTVLPGDYAFSVTGTSGALVRSTTVNVTVIATPAGVIDVVDGLISLGCIGNGGIGNAFKAKLQQAQKAIESGDLQTAINTLRALLRQLEAQGGKHLVSCTDGSGTIDGAEALIAQVEALLASLGASLAANPVLGALAEEMKDLTVTIAASAGPKTILATAETDATGFYYFARTGDLKKGVEYTVTVSFPKKYKTSTPSTYRFVWTGGEVTLGPLR